MRALWQHGPRQCTNVCRHEPVLMQVELPMKLGLPLLAPHPSIARHFSLKTGARQLFRSAKVHVAPGAELTPRAPASSQTRGAPAIDQHHMPSGLLMAAELRLLSGRSWSLPQHRL